MLVSKGNVSRRKLKSSTSHSMSLPEKAVRPPIPSSIFPIVLSKLIYRFLSSVSQLRTDSRNMTEIVGFYVGREKFTELLDKFEEIREDAVYTDPMIYGTNGYGKSHLLAALVCYSTSREPKVVYIPDCRTFFKDPVAHMKSAMLFAWADDESEQQNIMALTTQEEIYEFFRLHEDAIFVIDQLNALEGEKDEEIILTDKVQIRGWLKRLREPAGYKAILSSSPNNSSIHEGVSRQSTDEIMYVYGGFTRVSLRSNNSFVKWMLLTMI